MKNEEYTKHKVATDALETLGMLIPEGSGRDAIHLAVEPAVCGPFTMMPGARALMRNGEVLPAGMFGNAATGIVDPFLAAPVKPGDRFWFVILPRKITSLRHVWSHPDFPEEPASAYHADADDHYVPEIEKEPAMAAAWVRQWCADNADEMNGMTYEQLMDAAKDWLKKGRYYYGPANNTFSGGENLPHEFWEKYELITGEQVSENERENFFSCSC
jgi:hypothetical protein